MSQPLRSHRRLLLALAVLSGFAAVLLGLPSASQAAKTGHDYTCYSDPGHTHEIGYHYYCPGYGGGWGTLSGYCVSRPYPCT
jgi:hypothetical protein